MNAEISSLIIRVDSDKVKEGSKNLGELTHSAEAAEKATDKLKDIFKEIIGPLLAVGSAVELAKKVFEVTEKFETLERGLVRIAGSAETAHEVFESLREIAASTRTDIEELTHSFTKLSDAGLNPSKEALVAYSNIAKSTNKSLEEVVNTVALAAQGQFRGLHQLYISAIEVEDGIALTYKGTTTTIKRDSAELQNYITNLGKTDFLPAKGLPKTLAQEVTDLKIAYEDLFAAIGTSAGGRDLFAGGFRLASDAVKELTAEISSGQLKSYILAIVHEFDGMFLAAYDGVTAVTSIFQSDAPLWYGAAKEAINFIIDAIKYLPINVKAASALIGATFALQWQYIEAGWRGLVQFHKSVFDFIVEQAKAAGSVIGDILAHPFQNPAAAIAEYSARTQGAFEKFVAAAKNSTKSIGDLTDAADAAFEEEIASILNVRDADVSSTKARIKAADDLRAAWEKARKAREDASAAGEKPDVLNRKPTGSTRIVTPEELAQFKSLKDSLQLEEDTIATSYKHRLNLIRNNTQAGSDLQVQLIAELNSRVELEYDKAAQDRVDKAIALEDAINQAISNGELSRIDGLQAALDHEEALIKASYERRKQQIINDSSLTEDQKNKKIAALDKNRALQTAEEDRRAQKLTLDRAADFFGNLETISKTFGARGARIAKAAAIVQATIKTYESATSAYAAMAGIPYVGPALGAVAAAAAIAAGIANVRAIESQQTPTYEYGGMIPAGSAGIAGEAGAEFIRGPAVVSSARSTADRQAGAGSGKQVVNISIVNQSDAVATVTKDTSEGDRRTIEVLVKRSEAQIASNIRTGGSPISAAISQTFGVKRQAA